jgi:hypothetical protein
MWGRDITVGNDDLINGGRYKAREIQDLEVRAALLGYLIA